MNAPPIPRVLLAIPVRMGLTTISVATQIGGIVLLAGRFVARLLPPRLDRLELLRNFYKSGVRSVPIVVATAFFTGGIMIIQSAPLLLRFSAVSWIGWGASFTIVRELGPLLIALMFNGRVGANNTAELSTMVVTDQVNALRALSIDPISYLVMPRVLAMVTTLFLLTVIGDAVALGGAILTSDLLLNVDPRTFLYSATARLEGWDIYTGLIKSVFFGFMIALTSCHFGLSTTGGAPGVGRSVNASVVAAASGIFIADYLSTFILG